MRLLVFNPWNDIALANGDPNFCLPAAVSAMAAELAKFPLAWADEDDIIYIPGSIIKPEIAEKITKVIPWGWSPLLKQMLLKSGIPVGLLPSKDELDNIRRLSHRETSVILLDKIQQSTGYSYPSPELPRVFTDTKEAEAYIDTNIHTLFKLPWSSSGKGLYWCERMDKAERDKRIAASIKRMGSVTVEKRLERVIDFAMLFNIDDKGNIIHEGYSIFKTDEKGAYMSNMLASNEHIFAILGRYIDIRQLNILKDNIINLIPDVIKYYTGPFGIDMMIYRENNDYKLHPCVEINLRTSMGHAARRFYDKHCGAGTGEFFVSVQNDMKQFTDNLIKNFPHVTENGKLREGCLLLTPVNEKTKHCIYVMIDRI